LQNFLLNVVSEILWNGNIPDMQEEGNKKPHSLGSGEQTHHLSRPEEIKKYIQSGFLAPGSIYSLRLPTI
jgi:hypothetical protein